MMANRVYTSGELIRQIKFLIVFFIVGLVLSGLTAFPIKMQLEIAHSLIGRMHLNNEFTCWIEKVHDGVAETDKRYPFIAYGTDWLAFAHLMIALVFIGPLRDPMRNSWVIQFGIMACVAVFPLAFIAGEVRGIPFFWRLIDCSFGLFGGIVLWICHRKIVQLGRRKAV